MTINTVLCKKCGSRVPIYAFQNHLLLSHGITFAEYENIIIPSKEFSETICQNQIKQNQKRKKKIE